MDDPQITPDPSFPEENCNPAPGIARVEPAAALAPPQALLAVATSAVTTDENAAFRWRKLRKNLFLLFSLALTAFILTSWILVRVDSPFGIFSTGPQELVREQLRALDRGELRPAYDMFSARYRGQVSFDAWHELCVRHWQMFHANIVRAETTSQFGPGATLEIYLRGSDDKDYRARFKLVRSDGRWWIDDVHWTQEAGARDVSRI